MNSKGNTIFWAIIACLLWSTAYAGIKLGLQFDKPFHFAGVRFIISGSIILPFTVKPHVVNCFRYAYNNGLSDNVLQKYRRNACQTVNM